MLRAHFVRGRMVALAAVGFVGIACATSPSAAQSYSNANALSYSSVNAPYDAALSQSQSVYPVTAVQPAGYYEMHEGEPAVPAAPAATESADAAAVDSAACHTCGHHSCRCALPRACDRFYVSVSGGWQAREPVHEASDFSTFIDFNNGFAVNAALGYRFDMFRTDIEYTFMNNECETAGSGGLSSTTVGNVNLRALMFNAYHDVEIDGWNLKPYLGAGIGLYQSELNGLFPEFFQTVGGAFATTPINATSNMPFAYQFRVGASYPIGDRTDLFGGYRYFHGEELTFSSAPFAGPGAPVFRPNSAWTHNIEFGLRIKF